jgi:uncharacterized protein involved in exopolysaccharide biosynthesis
VAHQLATARSTFAVLEGRLKPAHPDLQRMQRVVSDLEARAALEAANSAAAAAAPSPAEQRRQGVPPTASGARPRRSPAGTQGGGGGAAAGLIRTYQQRIERVPARESELAELTRDYSTLQTLYQTLLAKQEESKIAANLERRQVGAQFKLLDPAASPKDVQPRDAG